MFNAKEFVAALEPPGFVGVDGTVYTGRHLSYTEALRWAERFEDLLKGDFSAEQTATEIRALAEAFGLPPDPLLELPAEACLAAFVSFFGSRSRTAAPGS